MSEQALVVDRDGRLALRRREGDSTAALVSGLALLLCATAALEPILLAAWAVLLAALVPHSAIELLSRRRVRRLLREQRYDEVEVHYRHRLEVNLPRAGRVRTHLQWATLRYYLGDHGAALAQIDEALALLDDPLLQRRLGDGALARVLRFRVEVTIASGALDLARQLLAPLGAHRTVGEADAYRDLLLQLQFAERRLLFDRPTVASRAALLRQRGDAGQLALAAWALGHLGDRAASAELLAVAVERYQPWRRRAWPAVWAWVERRIGRSLDGARPGMPYR